MSATELLKAFKKDLDVYLIEYLDQKISDAEKISPFSKEIMEHIADLTLRGGKRIRAAIFYYSYIAHGGKDRKRAMRAAMAQELAETYLLIHDDIIDNDCLRRGGTTIHESYRHIGDERYHEKISSKHFGSSVGMLAGDIANGLSNEILAESGFRPDHVAKALMEFNKIYVIECYGQALDMFYQLSEGVTRDNVLQIHSLKTVPYTFDGPIRLGAILAGRSDKDIKKLEGYSTSLGIAFQIQDDILGMFGSVEKLGKPVTSDLKEGKKTLLILNALEKASRLQKEIINSSLGNKRANMHDLREVRRVIEDTWSLAESKRLASTLVQKAIDSIQPLHLQKEGKTFLLDIADYMIHREV